MRLREQLSACSEAGFDLSRGEPVTHSTAYGFINTGSVVSTGCRPSTMASDARSVSRSMSPAEMRSIFPARAMSPTSWSFTVGREVLPVAVLSRLVVSTAEAAIDAAIAGTGITRVLSYQVADAVQAGKLAVVLAQYEPPRSPVSLVTNGQGLLPQKLRAFLDFAAPLLRARMERCEL